MRAWQPLILSSVVICNFALSFSAFSQDAPTGAKFYRVIDGKADARTYNGFRRYNAGCSHCHGPDGVGSTFASSLVDRLPDIGSFRRIVGEAFHDRSAVALALANDPPE